MRVEYIELDYLNWYSFVNVHETRTPHKLLYLTVACSRYHKTKQCIFVVKYTKNIYFTKVSMDNIKV